jgi:hypothetical protein
VLSLLALACWFGGLVLLQVSPALGACVTALGFVFAGKALKRPDDMETMFGLAFMAILAVGAWRIVAAMV